MDDILSVAVVNGRDDLMHDIGCVSFCELLSGVDLIKELATGTKSRYGERSLLSDQIEARSVLEELIQLHNIWVILRLRSVTSCLRIYIS